MSGFSSLLQLQPVPSCDEANHSRRSVLAPLNPNAIPAPPAIPVPFGYPLGDHRDLDCCENEPPPVSDAELARQVAIALNEQPRNLHNDDKPIPGRPRESNTVASRRRAQMLERKAEIRGKKISLADCVWPAHKQCKHDCAMPYPPHLIKILRMYFYSKKVPDQRNFIHPMGGRCDLNQRRLNDGGNLAGAHLYENFRLEKPAILERRFSEALTSQSDPVVPVPEDCNDVCQKFLLWAVGRSSKFLNRQEAGVKRRLQVLDAADRVFEVNPVRRCPHVQPSITLDQTHTDARLHTQSPTHTHNYTGTKAHAWTRRRRQ